MALFFLKSTKTLILSFALGSYYTDILRAPQRVHSPRTFVARKRVMKPLGGGCMGGCIGVEES